MQTKCTTAQQLAMFPLGSRELLRLSLRPPFDGMQSQRAVLAPAVSFPRAAAYSGFPRPQPGFFFKDLISRVYECLREGSKFERVATRAGWGGGGKEGGGGSIRTNRKPCQLATSSPPSCVAASRFCSRDGPEQVVLDLSFPIPARRPASGPRSTKQTGSSAGKECQGRG